MINEKPQRKNTKRNRKRKTKEDNTYGKSST